MGSSVGSPAQQYGLTCKDHDHELDAVVKKRLGGGDEPPDDQRMHQIGAVGEPAENLPTEQSVDGTWNEMPRYLNAVGKRRPLESHHGAPHSQSSSPMACKSKSRRFPNSLQQKVGKETQGRLRNNKNKNDFLAGTRARNNA